MKAVIGILIGLLFIGTIGTFVLGFNALLSAPVMQKNFLALGWWKIATTLAGSAVISFAVLFKN